MSPVVKICVALLAAGFSERTGPVRRIAPARVHVITNNVPDGARRLSRLPNGRWLASLPEWLMRRDMLLPEPAHKSTVEAGTAPVAVVVEFYRDVSPGDADAVLQQSGVSPLHHPDLLPTERLGMADGQQIRTLTEWDEVAHVYAASADLVEGHPVRGCNGPGLVASNVAFYTSSEGVGWAGAGGGNAELTWSISGGSIALSGAAVEAIGKALAEWSRHTAVTFRRTTDTRAARSLAYSFARGEHMDPYPFDGPGKVLAHAFYPADLNPEPIAGDVHLDEDEPWSTGSEPDIYSVVLHETGHALGLGHSDRPGAVMYPYHRILTTLQADDIEAIQRLYGNAVATPLTVSFTAPVTTAQTSVEISGTVNGGSGDAWVTWSKGTEGGFASGGRQWRTPAIPLASGVNRILIAARDEAQNTVSREAVVTMNPAAPPQQQTPAPAPAPATDRINPSLTITSPAGSVYGTSAATIRIRGTARDNVGVREVTWQCGSSSGVANGTLSWSFDLPLLVGDNNVIVRARDQVGNTGWRNVLITRR